MPNITEMDGANRSMLAQAAEARLSADNFPTYLTPEALLGYCQSRLRDLDRSIQDRFASEQNTIKLQRGLNSLKTYIQEAAKDSSISPSEKEEIDRRIAALKDLTGDSDLKDRIDAVGVECVSNLTPDGATNGPIKGLDDIGKDLGSGRELTMIELQSVVSQRQTALQLTTNLMNAINQSSQNIVNNLK